MLAQLNRSIAKDADPVLREQLQTLNLMTVETLVPLFDKWLRESEEQLNRKMDCGHPEIFRRIAAFAHQPRVLVHKDSDGHDVPIETFMVDPHSIVYECAWCVEISNSMSGATGQRSRHEIIGEKS